MFKYPKHILILAIVALSFATQSFAEEVKPVSVEKKTEESKKDDAAKERAPAQSMMDDLRGMMEADSREGARSLQARITLVLRIARRTGCTDDDLRRGTAANFQPTDCIAVADGRSLGVSTGRTLVFFGLNDENNSMTVRIFPASGNFIESQEEMGRSPRTFRFDGQALYFALGDANSDGKLEIYAATTLLGLDRLFVFSVQNGRIVNLPPYIPGAGGAWALDPEEEFSMNSGVTSAVVSENGRVINIVRQQDPEVQRSPNIRRIFHFIDGQYRQQSSAPAGR